MNPNQQSLQYALSPLAKQLLPGGKLCRPRDFGNSLQQEDGLGVLTLLSAGLRILDAWFQLYKLAFGHR